MLHRIHINQHKIRANKKHGTNEPVISIKAGKQNTYCHSVEILGPSRVVYSPCKPLSCGARVWVETESELVIDGRS
jgi:transcriptional regulator of heat shock response